MAEEDEGRKQERALKIISVLMLHRLMHSSADVTLITWLKGAVNEKFADVNYRSARMMNNDSPEIMPLLSF